MDEPKKIRKNNKKAIKIITDYLKELGETK